MALDLPDEFREGLTAWGEAELIDPALRPVRPESLHVTLVFLGHREADEVAAIADLVRGLSAPAVLMKLEDPITLPRRRRAALFALPAPSPATADLHHGLVDNLVAEGLHERRGARFLAACDGRQGAAGGSRIASSGGRREAARRPPGAAQRAVLCRPIDALPF